MKKTSLAGRTAKNPGLQRSERNKLIFMSVLLLLVLIAVVTAKFQEQKYHDQEDGEGAPEEIVVDEQVVVPELDAAQVAQHVNERTPDARALLDTEGLDLLVEHVRRLGAAHYRVLGIRELTGPLAAEIQDDPDANRFAPCLVRGLLDVDTIKTQKRRPDAPEEYLGILTLGDGSRAHVLVLDMPEIVNSTPFLRVDGLFYKVYRAETADGWVEAPLVVAREATRSYPDLGEVRTVPEALLLEAQDDTAKQITPFPYYLKWNLMAYARDLAPGDVDWEAAPLFDNEMMLKVIKDGDAYRGQPFLIPISRIMDVWVHDVPENPARIDRAATGWIGNQFWTGGAIKFDAPIAETDLRRGSLATARGFFLKNHAFEPLKGGIQLAPYFVMASVDEHVPAPDRTVQYFMWAMVGLTLGMIGLFVVLLMRDKRRSAELQKELVRRRRARRSKQDGGLEPAGASPEA